MQPSESRQGARARAAGLGRGGAWAVEAAKRAAARVTVVGEIGGPFLLQLGLHLAQRRSNDLGVLVDAGRAAPARSGVRARGAVSARARHVRALLGTRRPARTALAAARLTREQRCPADCGLQPHLLHLCSSRPPAETERGKSPGRAADGGRDGPKPLWLTHWRGRARSWGRRSSLRRRPSKL